jgi:putative MATE family efflux protein
VALAGVTASTIVFFTLIVALSGLWSGAGIIAAQRIGARDLDGFALTVRSGFIIPLLVSIGIGGLSLFASQAAVHAMIGQLPSAGASATYLSLRCWSLVPIGVSATLIVGLGAAGNRRLGVYVLAVINLIHIPLLLVLALGWGTHHPLGIAGAGISSLLSEIVAAVFSVGYVLRKPAYHIFESLKWSWGLAKRCALLGLPEVVFGFSILAPDVFIVAMLAPLGAPFVAGFRALTIVSDLTLVVPIPLQSATQTVVGQRLGATDSEGAIWFLHRARRLTIAITICVAVVVAVFARPLAYLLTLNGAVAALAARPLAMHMITLPLKGWGMVSIAPLRAAGDTKFSMWVGMTCGAIVLPVAWLCIERFHVGLYSVPIAWIFAWSARALLTSAKLRSGSWTRRATLNA